jgi:hypothetical protein
VVASSRWQQKSEEWQAIASLLPLLSYVIGQIHIAASASDCETVPDDGRQQTGKGTDESESRPNPDRCRAYRRRHPCHHAFIHEMNTRPLTPSEPAGRGVIEAEAFAQKCDRDVVVFGVWHHILSLRDCSNPAVSPLSPTTGVAVGASRVADAG